MPRSGGGKKGRLDRLLSVNTAALCQRARGVLDLAGRRIHRLGDVGNLTHARCDVGNAARTASSTSSSRSAARSRKRTTRG